MWITVENTLIFGDIDLGISKLKVKGFSLNHFFPHLSPQVFITVLSQIQVLVRKVICNYKKVISFTHLLTAVITTNYKYKFSLGDSMRVCEGL
jgi:hypothetical protein